MAASKKETKSAPAPEEPEAAPPAPMVAGPEGEAGAAGPPVAGVVASAGGLDAFKKLLTAMPADSGIAFVLVPHLDPNHESLMVELLARRTAMPVVEAAEGMAVLANHVYIIPPNKYMTMSGGVLRLTGPVERGDWQTSIDVFLRALADDQQEKAICIILSGTGSHGSLGLKAIKAQGGLTIVQDPGTAEYKHMPQSAVATGLADYVLPVEQMPEALIKYVQHSYVSAKTTGEAVEVPDDLNQVLALLRARTKFDFRCYRKKMLTRRVERRMGLNHIERPADYLAHLREHPEEVKQLARDLLISVTSFFRDPEAFRALDTEVIAPLVAASEPDAPLRVWVPACATGEEAYAIAILFLERLALAQKSCRLRIFGTDVDEDALRLARQGVYPESIAADVSAARLGRFFTRVDESAYQVDKHVREAVTFAAQNLISDPPFSKMDLVSCRNLLIYLEPEVQKRVIPLLHFALREGGALFLGSSETIGRHIDLFDTISKKWRIYRRIGPSRVERVEFPITAHPPTAQLEPQGRPERSLEAGDARPGRLANLAQRVLLEEFVPAAVLSNRKHEVVYSFGPIGRYLKVPAGEPTQDLLLMARDGLRTKLRAALHKAIEDGQAVTLSEVRVKRNGAYHAVTVTVKPVQSPRSAQGLLLVTFQDTGTPPPLTPPLEPAVEESLVRQLESDLRATREDLQSTIEELESANEELKGSNEEVLSMNEELQSSNEELETSKEELQSLNEELSTVNNQLHDKVAELEAANNDMANLFNSSDVATLFLDTGLRIRRYTPPATRLLNLIPTDVGRPVGDITRKFADPDLLPDAEQVLRALTPREKEVQTDDGRWWLRRTLLYRTLDSHIDGVVITFIDIDERKQAADAVDQARLYSEGIVETVRDPLVVLDGALRVRSCNKAFYKMFQVSAGETIGRLLYDLGNRHWDLPPLRRLLEEMLPQKKQVVDFRITHNFEIIGERTMLLNARLLQRQGDGANQILLAIEDITERNRMKVELEQLVSDRTAALGQSQEQLAVILNTAADAIITINKQGIIQSINAATERMFGYCAAEMIGQNVKMLMPSPNKEEHDGYLARYMQTGEKRIIGIGREVEGRRRDGSTFPVDLVVSEVAHLGLFTGILRDISQRQRLEREVVEIATLEQQRVGQYLHDDCGQELTALGLLADSLVEALAEHAPADVEIARKIGQGLMRVLRLVHNMARGLARAEVDPAGLPAALSELTARLSETSSVRCVFHGDDTVKIEDSLRATHLFHIAQEACTNALKHSEARNVEVRLQSADHTYTLEIQDDGTGISQEDPEGLGLRIMRNRAGVIGATLTIELVEPQGTVVRCTLPKK